MNVKQSKILYLSLIIIFAGIITTSVFYLLGGFKLVKVEKAQPVKYTLVGKQFVSHYTSKDWITFGKECKELLETGRLDGYLTVITYHTDSLKEDEISKFVGIMLNGDMAEIPMGFQVKRLQSNERYTVLLDMHVLVQPRPQNVEAMILSKAQTDGKELKDFFVEVRFPNGDLQVEGWAR